MSNVSGNPVSDAAKAALSKSTPDSIRQTKIPILLADGPSVFRDALRALLAAQHDFEIVAEASPGDSITALALTHRPSIILFEPETTRDALAILRPLQDADLGARIILLMSKEDPDMLTQAVRHGVAGVVARKSPTETLLKCIRKVHVGELWLDRATTAEVVRQLTSKPIPAPRHVAPNDKPVALSKREREIVGLVAQGFRNREMADKLFISEQTVKNHLHNIFEKIGVQDRLELALYAIYHRLYE